MHSSHLIVRGLEAGSMESCPSGGADHEGIRTSCPSFPGGRCSLRDQAMPGTPRSFRAPERLSLWHLKKNEPLCLHSWLYEIRWLKVITGDPFFSSPEAAGQTLSSFPSSRSPSVSSCSVSLDSETTFKHSFLVCFRADEYREGVTKGAHWEISESISERFNWRGRYKWWTGNMGEAVRLQ